MNSTTKLKGNVIHLNGEVAKVGSMAPDFKFVDQNLEEKSLHAIDAKVKVIMAFPSLDTGICAMQTRKFNAELGKLSQVKGICVSMDLPFAMSRFCKTEGVENIINASDFRYHAFGEKYACKMIDGPLQGLLARATFVLDQDNKIVFAEINEEITTEPNYEKVLGAVNQLI